MANEGSVAEGSETEVGDERRQNAMFTDSQREYLRGNRDDDADRATRQRMRERLAATVLDLGLALYRMERRDVRQAVEGSDLTADEIDEAIAFLELLRRHAGGGSERAHICIEHESGDIRRLESRVDRLEDGIHGLSEALGNIGDLGDRGDSAE